MRKRSSYRRNRVIADPLTFLRPATKAENEALMGRFYSALESMTRGQHPGETDWHDLADAINTLETLALHQKKLVASEVMPAINAAIRAMVLAADRYRAGKGMRFDAQGIESVRVVLGYYRDCLEGLTARELALAAVQTRRRLVELLSRKQKTSELVEI